MRRESFSGILSDGAGGCFHWSRHDYPSAAGPGDPRFHFALHVVRGGGTVQIGDYNGRFADGHVALVSADLPHDWISDGPAGQTIPDRDMILQFDANRLQEASALFPELIELRPLLDDASRGVEFGGATARAIVAAMDAIGASTGIQRLEHMFGLFAILAAVPVADRRFLASRPFLPPANAGLDAVIEYMLSNLDRELQMREVAAIAGVSGSHFSRLFKRKTGQTFVDFVRRLRVQKACRLLRQTDESVSSICYAVGFGNLSNFNRQFRKERGQSPMEYRRGSL